MTTETPLKPCPWCGKQPDIEQHPIDKTWRLTHICKVMGAFSLYWKRSRKSLIKDWNTRAGEKP